MEKFKVGDLVKVVDIGRSWVGSMNEYLGKNLKIRSISYDNRIGGLATLEGAMDENLGYYWQFNLDSLKLVKQTTDVVIFNDPATIVLWADGTKTVVKCQEGDTYDKEKGLALCYMKKFLGNGNEFNKVLNKFITYED